MGKKDTDASDQQDKSKNKKNRGTKDEFEAVASIVAENVGLKNRILDKIRQMREDKRRREQRTQKKTEPVT